ncbi:MAG: insulinase family protein [Campylobacteraceae bacterium]|jgi:predicted Zn-dependent peptidase|nr:insulinase family protein [Campylobacteraceae bacterium]
MSQEVKLVSIKGIDVPIIFEEDKNLPIVSMQLVFLSSGSIEDNDTAGLAVFASRMLSEGTLDVSSVDFAKALEERAINFNVNSGTETLVFALSSLKEEFDFGVGMVEKVLQKPNISKVVFDKVYTQTMGVILDSESDFDYVANTALRNLMYENSSFGLPSLGTKESIKKINIKKIDDFIKNHLDLSNLIVVIGGDINEEQAKKSVQKLLSSLKVGKKRELPFFNVSVSQKSETKTRQSEQAYVYFGAPFYMKVNDNDTFKAKVAGFILGESGFGSRLMEEIRVKRGLAYSAYSRFSAEKSSSSFTGYLQTKNESKDEAIKIVKEVISDFSKNGVKEKELEQAKKFLLGSEPLRIETLSQRLSRSFYEYYRGLGLRYFKNELKKIENLSLKELNEFIFAHPEINELIFSIVTNDNSQNAQR